MKKKINDFFNEWLWFIVGGVALIGAVLSFSDFMGIYDEELNAYETVVTKITKKATPGTNFIIDRR